MAMTSDAGRPTLITTTPSTLNCSGNTTNSSVIDGDTDSLNYAEFERLLGLIVAIVFGVVTLVGCIGNLLVIVVIAANKHMRSTTNIFIFSLAIADLTFITFCVPFTAVNILNSRWPFGDVWCRIVEYLKYVCFYASVYTLVAMTFDRFLAVVYPMSSRAFRVQANATRTVIIVWLVILLANIPLLALSGLFSYVYEEEHRLACLTIVQFKDDTHLKALYGTLFAFGYVIPFALMCILYAIIIQSLVHRTIPSESKTTNSTRTRKRVTRMVVVVVTVFAICWLPIQVVFMRNTFGYSTNTATEIIVQYSANALSYINSCLNPILYAFLSESFRESFKDLLSKRLRNGLSSDTGTRQTSNRM